MTSIQFTEADRDERGFVKAPAPADDRSLADLLPPTTDDRRPTTRVMLTRQDVISMAIVVPLMIVALLYISSSPSAPRVAPAVPRLAPAQAVPTVAPVPTAPPVAMLSAYGAPNEAPRWQIEATRAITPVAHFGSDWIQAQVEGAGPGLLWLRATDFPALAITGPDLAPKAAAAPAAVATSTPENEPPCFTAGMGNQQVTVCDWLSAAELQAAAAAKWAATYGGHVGSGDIEPSPQPWESRKDLLEQEELRP